MAQKPKILAFAGSLRTDSYNKQLLKIAADAAQEAGCEVKIIDFKNYPMPIYDADIEEEEGLPGYAKEFKMLMVEADGFLISAPEYNSSLSAVLKNSIDWASRPEDNDPYPLWPFKGKTAALLSASPGRLGGLRGLFHLRDVLQNIYINVLPEMYALNKADSAFNPDGSLISENKQKAAESVGKNLAQYLLKLQDKE
jgi:NAD(P)H-dependent FMN reductase